MEEDDKGCPMITMGVSGWMFLLVPAYPGSPGQKAVKRLCVCVCIFDVSKTLSDLGHNILLKKNKLVNCRYVPTFRELLSVPL